MTARNLDAARVAWGEAMPDWIDALARAADRTNQVQVAEALGVSASAVNAVIRNRYGAHPARIEQRVRGRLMAETVACPVLGELASDLCLEWQRKAEAFHDTGQLRRRMYRACRACPASRWHKESNDAE
jgi:predicted transcriptional regulator